MALDGKLRPINSILPSVIFAKENNYEYIFIPEENAKEASLIPDIKIIPIAHLNDIVNILTKEKDIEFIKNIDITKYLEEKSDIHLVDFSQVI